MPRRRKLWIQRALFPPGARGWQPWSCHTGARPFPQNKMAAHRKKISESKRIRAGQIGGVGAHLPDDGYYLYREREYRFPGFSRPRCRALAKLKESSYRFHHVGIFRAHPFLLESFTRSMKRAMSQGAAEYDLTGVTAARRKRYI